MRANLRHPYGGDTGGLGTVDSLRRAIVRHADRHANADGLAFTRIPALRMMCVRAPSGPMHSIYKPLVCFVLQGAKQMTIGAEIQEFSAGQSVIVGVDIPVTGRIVSATAEKPYLALAVELDMAVIRDLATQMNLTAASARASTQKFLAEDTDAAALDCAARLMRLSDRPDAARMLAPGVMRELHFWLLSSTHSESIRRMAAADGPAQRIAAAVKILRTHIDKPIEVARLAAAAGMSASTFHRRFKAMTSLTPVQFRQRLRLIEARRLMLNEGRTASRAAYDVGYESVSQFTREYARLFGAPPRRDTRGRSDVHAAAGAEARG